MLEKERAVLEEKLVNAEAKFAAEISNLKNELEI